MLLGNKKTQADEQNWSIVLNPVRNEIDKKRVAQKISQVFSLSAEEAADLVANTPIILLDNLTRPAASKVRDFFLSTGAEMILTNDTFLKRKCYRTVWPEPPNLSFLRGLPSPETQTSDPPPAPQEDHEILDAEEAIRSLQKEETREEESGEAEDLDLDSGDPELLLEEIRRLRRECLSLREEAGRLQEESDRRLKDSSAARAQDFEISLRERDKEIREIRVLLANAEEKYEVLKQEYREARAIFEEKLALSARENEHWKIKLNEMTEDLQTFRQEKQALFHAANQKESELTALRQEIEKLRAAGEAAVAKAKVEAGEWRFKMEEMAEKMHSIERAGEEAGKAAGERLALAAEWREKSERLSSKIEMLNLALEQEKGLLFQAEERQRDFEKNQLRLIQELEVRSREIRQGEAKCQELEKAAAEMREAVENQHKMLETAARQVETRDREIETVRRQLREVNLQLEQRESAARKTQIAGDLVEKENRLNHLVKEQERIEAEMKEREEAMRRVLAEQEAVERGIIEAKQVQRHLMEQAKRNEKPGLAGRIKMHRGQEEASAEPGPAAGSDPGGENAGETSGESPGSDSHD